LNYESSVNHIVIVSNRGPFSFAVQDGTPTYTRGDGGLVTAISSVARNYDVIWLSHALSDGDRQWLSLAGPGAHIVDNMKIRLIDPDPVRYHQYYNIISNPMLWFIHHQLYDPSRSPIIDEASWLAWRNGYVEINRSMAEAVAETIATLDGPVNVMIQDYHFYLVPLFLRALVGKNVTIQFFLHIPWPGADAWRMLPVGMRNPLLEGLLYADRIGFQTERDTRRFLQTCAANLPDLEVTKPWRTVRYQGRQIHAAPYPISIDVMGLEEAFPGTEIQAQVTQLANMGGDRKLILRVDRIEPSKNILRGLIAYQNFLNAYPAWQGKVYMLALLVPSRGKILEYKHYLRDIMTITGELNATLGTANWEPVRIMLGNNYPRALAALSMYDVLMVNPLADGMNLVAKEGVLLNQRDGVLILSEEAGVAEELGNNALLVSPFDVYGTREAINAALTMPMLERRERASAMRQQVRQNDIHQWFRRQIDDGKGSAADKVNAQL